MNNGVLDKSFPIFFNPPSDDLPDAIVKKNKQEVGKIKDIKFNGRYGEAYVKEGGFFTFNCKGNVASYELKLDFSNLYYKMTAMVMEYRKLILRLKVPIPRVR